MWNNRIILIDAAIRQTYISRIGAETVLITFGLHLRKTNKIADWLAHW